MSIFENTKELKKARKEKLTASKKHQKFLKRVKSWFKVHMYKPSKKVVEPTFVPPIPRSQKSKLELAIEKRQRQAIRRESSYGRNSSKVLWEPFIKEVHKRLKAQDDVDEIISYIQFHEPIPAWVDERLDKLVRP